MIFYFTLPYIRDIVLYCRVILIGVGNMEEVKFSREAYKDYLENKDIFSNERIRPEDVSFLDAMLSEEANFTNTPEGKQIVEIIKAL
jgi:hypothetical protein